MTNNTFALIMAGGIGSRFWPFSRETKPKQFLDILGTGKSLLQMTFERLLGICNKENILIITNEHYKPIVIEQLPNVRNDQILAEPVRRNTAPCIAYGTYKVLNENQNANIIVVPSDHLIINENGFHETLDKGINFAQNNNAIVTVGIKPTRAETGYGYIEYQKDGEELLRKVTNFTEKPGKENAEKFLKLGNYLWNSGIFIWHIKTIINAFIKFLPEINQKFESLNSYYGTDEEQTKINEIFPQCPDLSIDYGILEKADNVFVIDADFDWSDLGSWKSLHDVQDKDENGNVSTGEVMLFDTKDSLILGSKEKLILTDKLEGYLVADYGNALLICPKDNEKRIKEFVNAIRKNKGQEFL